MTAHYQRKLLTIAIITGMVWTASLLAGCAAPQIQMPEKICPGKNSVGRSKSVLKARSRNAVSFKANGQCFAKFDIDGQIYKENFNVKLWASPPTGIRLQGDVVFNPRGIDTGSNDSEFWLAMKPKEIGNSYFWGRWSDGACFKNFAIQPQILLEALGISRVNTEYNWSLVNKAGFDILTKRSEQAEIVKKIHISCCDYLVKKIEYFGADGQITIKVRLAEYKEISDGFAVPGMIEIVSVDDNGKEDMFRITLGSVRAQQFSQRQRQALFNRPEPRGFEHIYRVINGELVE